MKKLFLSMLMLAMVSVAMAGTTDTLQVRSEKMNRDILVFVTTPAITKENKNKRFPVVYLLHGYSDNGSKWYSLKPNLADIADRMQMIFVCPSANNSWYFDSPLKADMQFETFCSKELIAFIDAEYPTIADRSKRAVTGLSMGGHGALYLSIRHKDVFGAAAAMSGGVDIRPFPLNWELPNTLGEMASNRQIWDEHSVMEVVKTLKNRELAITFDCGESDFFIEVNKALHNRMLSLGIDHDFTTRPGGHTNEYWKNALDYHLFFFKKFFDGEMMK